MPRKTKKQQYETRTEALVTPIAEKWGVRIYDVDYVREGQDYYLNVYIDKDGGVNIGDCENVSRELSDALDAEDFIASEYTLVVSSPGLGRTLTKDRHLQNSIGQEVEIRTYKPQELVGSKEFSGILTAFDADTVTILCAPAPKGRKKKQTADEETGEIQITVNRKEIAVIRLAIDF